jgi:hypothetical protein
LVERPASVNTPDGVFIEEVVTLSALRVLAKIEKPNKGAG